MERKVVQDIVPTNKRTVRNIAPKKKVVVEEEDGEEVVEIKRPPASSSIARSQTRFAELAGDNVPTRISRKPMSRPAPMRASPGEKPRRRFPSILLTFLVIFIGIAVIAVALSLLYSKASVTITPKTAHIDINGTYTAKKAGDATLTSGALAYDTISATETMTQSVAATAGPVISSKAKGTATLFNEQVTQQKIVAGTRLANADGDVYRTTETIVIPAGKPGAPGKIDAAILADAAGANYNMSLSEVGDLKVVAYKDTPKYTTVYGKIKTAITGGASGQKVTVAPEVLKAATATMKETINAKLLSQAKTLTPKDSILYPNSYVIEYETPEPVAKGADSAEMTIKGTLTGATFKKTDLLKSIAAKELDKFPAPSYDIQGLKTSDLPS
jgi:hypothetical protein